MNGSISTMYNVEIAQRKNDDTEISYQKSDNQDESSED